MKQTYLFIGLITTSDANTMWLKGMKMKRFQIAAAARIAACCVPAAFSSGVSANTLENKLNSEDFSNRFRGVPILLSEGFEVRWSAGERTELPFVPMVNAPETKIEYFRFSKKQSDYINTIKDIYSSGRDTPLHHASSRETASECGPSPASAKEIEMMVRESAKGHGVNPDFAAAIAWVESRFDRNRNSSAGARGPMQLMPDTAERFGVADVCDPVSNIEGGVKYLRTLLDQFKDPMLVAAAYNSGEGRVQEHNGIPPFKETVAYVAKVMSRQRSADLPTPQNRPRAESTFSSPDAAAPDDATRMTADNRRTFVRGVMSF